MEVSSKDLSPRQCYKLMTGAIVPRPIGWISTRSTEGFYNLAPYSYFNAVASDPPTLMFSSGRRDPSRPKDSLKNIQDTGEFVVNIVTASLAEAMNASAVDAPHGSSEFEIAGVTPGRSRSVAAPRVAESPVHFECKLAKLVEFGSNIVVFGEIVHIHIDDEVLLAEENIDMAKLKPLGRLAGSSYATFSDIFEMARPAYKDLIVKEDD